MVALAVLRPAGRHAGGGGQERHLRRAQLSGAGHLGRGLPEHRAQPAHYALEDGGRLHQSGAHRGLRRHQLSRRPQNRLLEFRLQFRQAALDSDAVAVGAAGRGGLGGRAGPALHHGRLAGHPGGLHGQHRGVPPGQRHLGGGAQPALQPGLSLRGGGWRGSHHRHRGIRSSGVCHQARHSGKWQYKKTK